MTRPDRIIITGGPGAGKSTLVAQLEQWGYPSQQEVARKVIEASYLQNISPWGDIQAFVKLVYEQMMEEIKQIGQSPVFCDRGILDGEAYLAEAGLVLPAYLRKFNPHLYYRPEVFILPPWPQIYRQEPARQQSWEKAVALYKSIVKTYQAWGFKLIEVPPMPVADRAEFVLQKIDIVFRKERWEKI